MEYVHRLPRRLQDIFRQIKFVAFDFDGVFTDNSVYVSENGQESVRCYRGDGLGLQRIYALGIRACVISSEKNPVVRQRCEKLDIACHAACESKQELLASILSKHQLTPGEAAFVGNDLNDLECLEFVALPIVVRDAHPDVLPAAIYRTRNAGGHGAVREVCDLLAAARRTNTDSPAGGSEAEID